MSAAPVENSLIVTALRWEAQGVVGVSLAHPRREALPEWQPGAHVSIRLLPGLERQYSLCGPLSGTTFDIAVRHCPRGRGGSDYLHRFLRPGQIVEVSAPRNHFRLRPARQYLLIAGGIGITPVLTMARALQADGQSWTMLYIGRRRAEMPFVAELESFGDRVDIWVVDERGRPDIDAVIARTPAGTGVYVCGPTSLMDATENACEPRPDLDAYSERFQAAAVSHSDDRAFDVVCQPAGTEFRVEADESLLDALARAGHEVPGSCREGLCGTCEVTVLDGEPEHRDHMGFAELTAPRVMAACVSRAVSSSLKLEL